MYDFVTQPIITLRRPGYSYYFCVHESIPGLGWLMVENIISQELIDDGHLWTYLAEAHKAILGGFEKRASANG